MLFVQGESNGVPAIAKARDRIHHARCILEDWPQHAFHLIAPTLHRIKQLVVFHKYIEPLGRAAHPRGPMSVANPVHAENRSGLVPGQVHPQLHVGCDKVVIAPQLARRANSGVLKSTHFDHCLVENLSRPFVLWIDQLEDVGLKHRAFNVLPRLDHLTPDLIHLAQRRLAASTHLLTTRARRTEDLVRHHLVLLCRCFSLSVPNVLVLPCPNSMNWSMENSMDFSARGRFRV